MACNISSISSDVDVFYFTRFEVTTLTCYFEGDCSIHSINLLINFHFTDHDFLMWYGKFAQRTGLQGAGVDVVESDALLFVWFIEL